MGEKLLTNYILEHYEVIEKLHACAILKEDFPQEWADLINVLETFKLKKSWLVESGGRKSKVSDFIDSFLYEKGWEEKNFNTKLVVDDNVMETPTHKIDCYKNKVGIEIEWNNKDPFFDRDLNNFRLLFERRAVSVGIIITRCDNLQEIFDQLGRGKSYGASTTHMSKLKPRIESGASGGCPLLVFGITKKLYEEDI